MVQPEPERGIETWRIPPHRRLVLWLVTSPDETFGNSERRLDQPAGRVMLQPGPHPQESRHDPAQPLREAEPPRPPAEAHLEASEASPRRLHRHRLNQPGALRPRIPYRSTHRIGLHARWRILAGELAHQVRIGDTRV